MFSDASDQSPQFGVKQSRTFLCSDASWVRNQVANFSCPLLDTAAVGRQLWWACISKYMYILALPGKNFVLSELSLENSLFMTITSSRLYCKNVSVAQLWLQLSFMSLQCYSFNFDWFTLLSSQTVPLFPKGIKNSEVKDTMNGPLQDCCVSSAGTVLSGLVTTCVTNGACKAFRCRPVVETNSKRAEDHVWRCSPRPLNRRRQELVDEVKIQASILQKMG